MENIEYYIRKLRFKYHYIKANYLQRYYSNSKNPRIVQAKVTDRLLSLRTCPNDKYMLKPGEFLALEPKCLTIHSAPDNLESYRRLDIDRDSNQHSEIVTEVFSNNTPASEKNLKKEYLDSEESELQPFLSNGEHLRASCSCDCHQSHNQLLNINTSATACNQVAKNAKLTKIGKWLNFMDYSKKRLSEIPLTSSPVIEINSASSPETTPDMNNQIQMIDNTKEMDTAKENDQRELVSERPNKRRYSYTEGTSITTTAKPLLAPQAWRPVINEFSLSAARLSTGSTDTLEVISMYNY